MAQAVEGKVTSRRPRCEPLGQITEDRIIGAEEVDTLVVERPQNTPNVPLRLSLARARVGANPHPVPGGVTSG